MAIEENKVTLVGVNSASVMFSNVKSYINQKGISTI